MACDRVRVCGWIDPHFNGTEGECVCVGYINMVIT